MPSSRPNTIPVVLHLVRQLRPRSILDVGVGFGKWGHLFREYTDINEAERDPARYQRDHWQLRLDGIEGHAPYLTEMHRFLYNELHVGDARDILPRLPIYDVVFLGDIIEHFDKEAGVALLQVARAHAGRAVIVSTPRFETDQGDLCGNELERHRSLWSARDFKRWPGARVKTIDGDTLIAVLPSPGQTAPSFAQPKRPTADAQARLRQARAELIQHFGPEESFLLVDDEQLRATLPHRRARPFLEKDGVYWGPPADEVVAVTELKRAVTGGTRRIAFLWTCWWWLEHYPALRHYLEERGPASHQSEVLQVFDLNKDP
jgi:hypothetical protein